MRLCDRSEYEPALAYLAKGALDKSAPSRKSWSRQIGRICGPDAVQPMSKAYWMLAATQPYVAKIMGTTLSTCTTHSPSVLSPCSRTPKPGWKPWSVSGPIPADRGTLAGLNTYGRDWVRGKADEMRLQSELWSIDL